MSNSELSSVLSQIWWVFPLAVIKYGVFLWITYKFYKALARVGDKLSEINRALRSTEPRA